MRTIELETLQPSVDGVQVILFGASWSAPSRLVEAVLRRLEASPRTHEILYVEVPDQAPSDLSRYHIVGVPTVCVLHGGKITARLSGVRDEHEYVRYL
jgi:thioredoxin-like negative regulator of GroEL